MLEYSYTMVWQAHNRGVSDITQLLVAVAVFKVTLRHEMTVPTCVAPYATTNQNLSVQIDSQQLQPVSLPKSPECPCCVLPTMVSQKSRVVVVLTAWPCVCFVCIVEVFRGGAASHQNTAEKQNNQLY